MEIVSKLNGYRFHWEDEKCEELEMEQRGEDVGVIAQEVMDVLPEICTVRDNSYLAVRYEKLIPVLLQAINELQDQINELKGEG
jgi:predicted PolB exonuclease-like 3'-5' exonuclease